MLPEAKEIPHLHLKYFQLPGTTQQGLEFFLFKPEKENPKRIRSRYRLPCILKGPIIRLGYFLTILGEAFAESRYLNRVLGGFDDKTAKITTRCQLVTFRVLPLPPPASKPNSKL